MNKEELQQTAAAKSDQIDADNLIGGITMDVTIKAVQRGPSNEQPLQLVLEETDKFYRPSKTYRRALIGCFGDEPANWVGKRLRLTRNPDTMFGGVKVGGIEVSHASIPEPVVLMLASKRGKKSAVKIDVIPANKGGKSKAQKVEQVPKAAPAISGDPSEGDISSVGSSEIKPDIDTLRKVTNAFASIGMDIPAVEADFGKKIDEWTMADVDAARDVFKSKKAEIVAGNQQEVI